MGGGMWVWMILGLISLWAIVACIVRWAVGPRRTGATRDALGTLDARLAAGEITTEEYRRIRQHERPEGR